MAVWAAALVTAATVVDVVVATVALVEVVERTNKEMMRTGLPES